MIRPMSVLLPEPLEPTSAVVVPAGAVKRHVLEHRDSGLVLERDVLEAHLAADGGKRVRAGVALVLGRHRLDLADAVEAGERLGDLRADGRQLRPAAQASMPVNARYMTKPPIVIVPARHRAAADQAS